MDWAQQIRELRASKFVGREAELGQLERLLDDEVSSRVGYVHGMGGVGKSELLHAFGRIASRRNWRVHRIDCRDLPPKVEALQAAIQEPASTTEPLLLMLDTFEHLHALERAIRDDVLPELGDHCRVVVATREAPGREWRHDPAWAELGEFIELTELAGADAHEYLTRCGVAEEQRAEIVAAVGGFPLALALAAEAASSADVDFTELRADPMFVTSLLQGLLENPPTAAHRAALVGCAIVAHLSEDLLDRLIGEESTALYVWLRDRPYISVTPLGLIPHDLVRRSIVKSAAWRNPSLFHDLLRRAGHYYRDALRHHRDRVAVVLEAQHLFAHTGFAPFDVDGSLARDSPARPDDWPYIERLISAQYGEAGRAMASEWRDHPAVTFHVVWLRAGLRGGYFASVNMELLDPTERDSMPGVAHLVKHKGEPDGPWVVAWFWGSERHGHEVSPVQTRLIMWLSEQCVLTPSRFLGFCMETGHHWPHTGKQSSLPTVLDDAFMLGESEQLLVVRDLKTSMMGSFIETFDEWLAELESPAPPPMPAAGEFLNDVKEALKSADRPDLLIEHPFVKLHVITQRAPGTSLERATELVALLRELSEQFRATPRDEMYDDILQHTYFERTGKQRAIADDLNLSFGSYRRHLGIAIERLADSLYQLELGVRMAPSGG